MTEYRIAAKTCARCGSTTVGDIPAWARGRAQLRAAARHSRRVAGMRESELDEDEIEQAVQLAESMTIDDISGFRDVYRDALEELIEAKSEGKEPAQPTEGEAPQPSQVLDLMAALNASVQRARESRGETGEHATVHEMKSRKRAAAKKTAKKAPAKKAAAKKTTAKKTSSRKPRSA